MYLNDLWISDEAIERIAVSCPALEFHLAWRWYALPLLLDLPSKLTHR